MTLPRLGLWQWSRPTERTDVVGEDHAIDGIGWGWDGGRRWLYHAGLDGSLRRRLPKALLLVGRQDADRGGSWRPPHLLERVERVSVAVDRMDLVSTPSSPQHHRDEGDDAQEDDEADGGSHVVK